MASLTTRFRVRVNGRDYEGRIRPVDIVTIERQVGGVTEANKAEAMFRNSWVALRRQGVDVGDFDAFLDQLEDFEELDGDTAGEAAAPTGGPS